MSWKIGQDISIVNLSVNKIFASLLAATVSCQSVEVTDVILVIKYRLSAIVDYGLIR